MSNDFIKNEVLVHATALLHYAHKFTNNKDDAEDLVQNTLGKVLQSHSRFVRDTNVLGWIYTIMRNTFINDCRRKTLSQKYMNHSLSRQDMSTTSVSNNGERMFVRSEIQEALNSLPEKYYKPFMMHFEGYKYDEIAEYFDVPVGTIKTRIHCARNVLQQKLRGYK